MKRWLFHNLKASILVKSIMKRVVARRLAVNIRFRVLPPKSFCTVATEDVSTFSGKSSYGQKGNYNVENDTKQHDIAIVGGGMVGMALACSLATTSLTKHLNVAIVDSNPGLQHINCVKNDDTPLSRVSTVTPAAISFFKDIGAWEYIQQHRHAFFDKMQVWDYTGLGFTRYNARDADKDILGCVVENKVLHSSLLSCIQNMDPHIYHSKLTSLTLSPSSAMGVGSTSTNAESCSDGPVKLGLSDGSTLSAKLVVGADGAKSLVRQLAGFRTTGWNYPQNAIICTVQHSVKNTCAWQRFLPSGPIALLPLGGNFSNIVWTSSPNDASKFKSMDGSDLVNAINKALDHGYGPHPDLFFGGKMDIFPFSWFRGAEGFEVPPKVVEVVGERVVFPLSFMHANEYALKRIALVGDAAHTIHPLGGQGVNLGFGDAFSLSKVIADGIALGADIGELRLLKKYESERRPVNAAMMAILDGFQKAYSVDFGPLNLLRGAAFHGANHFMPIKRSIISFASGQYKLPFLLA